MFSWLPSFSLSLLHFVHDVCYGLSGLFLSHNLLSSAAKGFILLVFLSLTFRNKIKKKI